MKDFKLDDEPKTTSGFISPDGYFDAFSEKILAQLPKQETKVMLISRSKKTWYYAAAAVILLMISLPLYNLLAVSQQELDSATIENYLAYHATISEDEIVDLLDQEDLDRMKTELNVDDAAIEDILKTNSNLEEYLLD